MKTAIIAGQGRLPAALAAAMAERPLVAAMDGFAPDGLPTDLSFRVEQLVPFLRALERDGIDRVIFAGAVTRPRLDPALLDQATAALLPRLMQAMAAGDDATLRVVIELFEEFGFAVAGVETVAPALLPGAGVLAGTLTPRDEADAARAADIVTALGTVDVGQGAVVAQGLCLGVEALPGTDALLAQVAEIGALRPDPARGRGVFYKAAKPDQDRRIDLPTLGPETLRGVAAAGLGGLVFQAGSVICLDLARMQQLAGELGLFLGRESEPGDAHRLLRGALRNGLPAAKSGRRQAMSGPLKLFLIAGEPSGDRLGAALMAGLKALEPIDFVGIAGPLMQSEGMQSLFPMEELSVMGIAEILPKYLHLKRRIRETAAAALASGAEALVTIDSPDFCLRVAKIVKAARPDFRTIHYVAPSVWAWRPGRAAKMAGVIDHVLALLPFEPPYMTAAGMTCDFVGHPVVAEPLASPAEKAAFAGTGPLLLALPGSRRSEVSLIAPVLGDVIGLLKSRHPGLRVVLPTVKGVAGLVREVASTWPVTPQIIEDAAGKRGAFAAADVAVAASGTVSLELAANGCPMVIAYDMHPLTLWLMRRAALIDTVTLVNLVSETRVVPEFIGQDCRADRIAPALEAVLADPAAQKSAMALTMERLGKGGEPPGLRAARSVLAAIRR